MNNMIRCPRCGLEQPNSPYCPRCGFNFVVASQKQKGYSGFGVASFVLGLIGLFLSFFIIGAPISILATIFGIICLTSERNSYILPIAGIIFGIFGTVVAVFVCIDDISASLENSRTTTSGYSLDVVEEETSAAGETMTGVTGIEVIGTDEGELTGFEYEISNESIVLEKYTGGETTLTIKASYVVDDIEYTTNISDFQIGLSNNDVEVIIFEEGITEVKTSIFNCSDIKKIFFPSSMTNVYDYTLAYLHPDDDELIQIYYAGTQEEWGEIFTEYTCIGENDDSLAENAGSALADFMNGLIGVEYDSSDFEYFFSITAEDMGY